MLFIIQWWTWYPALTFGVHFVCPRTVIVYHRVAHYDCIVVKHSYLPVHSNFQGVSFASTANDGGTTGLPFRKYWFGNILVKSKNQTDSWTRIFWSPFMGQTIFCVNICDYEFESIGSFFSETTQKFIFFPHSISIIIAIPARLACSITHFGRWK
jgi:hypothetical protein